MVECSRNGFSQRERHEPDREMQRRLEGVDPVIGTARQIKKVAWAHFDGLMPLQGWNWARSALPRVGQACGFGRNEPALVPVNLYRDQIMPVVMRRCLRIVAAPERFCGCGLVQKEFQRSQKFVQLWREPTRLRKPHRVSQGMEGIDLGAKRTAVDDGFDFRRRSLGLGGMEADVGRDIAEGAQDASLGLLAEQARAIILRVARYLDEALAERLIEKAIHRQRRKDALQNPVCILKEHDNDRM